MCAESLVIGANSFVGRNLILCLLKEGEKVTGVYHRHKEYLPQDVPAFSVDDLEMVAGRAYAAVYIVSAYIPPTGPLLPECRNELFDVNVRLVARICSLFGGSRIVYCSTVSVYSQNGEVNTESSPTGGLNEYGISKLWGEKVISSHPDYAIVRFPSIYGGGMKPGTIIPVYIQQALSAGEIKVLGNGRRAQNYLHVADAVQYLAAAARKGGKEIYLASAPTSITNYRLAEIIAGQTQAQVTMEGEDFSASYYYDNSYTTARLGYSPTMYLDLGIKETIQWIKKEY
jgi:nucleoside-diphosphate-sugar epimerase